MHDMRPTINAFPLEYCFPALLDVREVDEDGGDALDWLGCGPNSLGSNES